MLTNNLKLALRLLSRRKAFSLVVIIGLSVSLAASILVVDYARFELSYDKFFDNNNRIYRVHHSRFLDNELVYKRAISLPEVGLGMKEYFPDVEEATRLFPISANIEPVFTATLKSGERRSFSEPNSYVADSSFCRVFKLDFIYGDPGRALTGPDKIIISRSTAMRYFGRADVVGETLKEKEGDLVITGVFNDLSSNSHFRFDMLLSWFQMYGDGSRFTWDGFYNYVLLKEDADITNVVSGMPAFSTSYMGDYYKGRPGGRSEFELQPLTSIHLDSHLDGEMTLAGNRSVVNSLLLVAIFMIAIAVINHINLNTSRSLERVKEVIVRKVIGSTKVQLSMQFMIEALLLSSTAACTGLVLALALYPSFNALFNSDVSLNLLQLPMFWAALALFIIISSVVSGFYPAFLLGGLKVREALKGSTIGNGRSLFQKTLVVGQFGISLILVVASYTLFKQVRFMQTKDLGFDIQRKLVIKLLPSLGDEGDTTFTRKMVAIKNELLLRSLCESSTISSSIPGRKNEWRGTAGLSGMGDQAVIRTNLTRVDEKFLGTFKLHLMAGRNFSDSPADNQYLIINEEAAKQFGLSAIDAIGKKIDMMGHREIIGVVESFHEAGLHDKLMPSMYITGAGYTKFLTVSMTANAAENHLSEVERIWKSQFADKPFQYFFLDEFFNRQYQVDVMMGKSIGLFSGIAIMVACLGLFSLSVFIVHRKTKEIGIKKVLGATVTLITSDLCQLFLAPICLSAFIAIPVSYYLVKWWLEQYSYRVDITVSLFALPLVVLMTIGICTVIFQSIRAAKRNPVESLKYE